jgi:hypothetical protein
MPGKRAGEPLRYNNSKNNDKILEIWRVVNGKL